MTKVLFLDDMPERHKSFRQAVGLTEIEIYPAYSASEAIEMIERIGFDQVFLDHDLSEEDIMCEVGKASLVPTGMTVVDHIIKMKDPPKNAIVHSCNEPAAREMERRLKTRAEIKVTRMAFPWLIRMI